MPALTGALLAPLIVLPRIAGHGEAAHTVGLTDGVRGVVAAGIEAEVVRAPGWSLEVFTTFVAWVRPNRDNEGPVRISPRQIRFPVGARLMWPLGDEYAWSLLAFHQSNHDIDTNDEALNRETIAYEIYGVEWWGPQVRLMAGLYYDRGTRLDGSHQTLPFDYYLGGAQAEAWQPIGAWGYGAGALELIGHLNEDHDPAHLNVNLTLEGGVRLEGEQGEARFFLRGVRLEDYRFLGDDPRHMLLIGVTLDCGPPMGRPGGSPWAQW